MPVKSSKAKAAATPANADEKIVKAPARARAKAAKTADAAAPVAASPARTRKPKAAPTAAAVGPAVDAEEIRAEAYLLWLGEGQPHGRDAIHWTMAEEIVRARLVTSAPAAVAAE